MSADRKVHHCRNCHNNNNMDEYRSNVLKLSLLPHNVTDRLCQLLDTSGRWRSWGSTCLNYTSDQLDWLEYRERLGFSPSRHILSEYKIEQDPTCAQLHSMLATLKFPRATELLQAYVSTSPPAACCRHRQPPVLPVAVREGGFQPSARCHVCDPFSRQIAVQDVGAADSFEYVRAKDGPKSIERERHTPSRHEHGAKTTLKYDAKAVAFADPDTHPNSAHKHTDCDRAEREQQPGFHDNHKYLLNVMHINYAELSAGCNWWDSRYLLGSGGFGSVYKCTWKNTEWAVKRVHIKSTVTSSSGQNNQVGRRGNTGGRGLTAQRNAIGPVDRPIDKEMKSMMDEWLCLSTYRHQNILAVCGYSLDGPEPLLLYQLMSNGSLLDCLIRAAAAPSKDPPPAQGSELSSWTQRLHIMAGVARALQFIHTRSQQNRLVHGDVKSANILLDSHMQPRLADFGLARELSASSSHTTGTSSCVTVSRIHGTRPYLPPEYLRSRHLSVHVDTYSFGVVLLELATGQLAYDDRRKTRMLTELVLACDVTARRSLIDRRVGVACAHVFDLFMSLADSCLCDVARRRPSMVGVYSRLSACVAFCASNTRASTSLASTGDSVLIIDSVDSDSTETESTLISSGVSRHDEQLTVPSTDGASGMSSCLDACDLDTDVSAADVGDNRQVDKETVSASHKHLDSDDDQSVHLPLISLLGLHN